MSRITNIITIRKAIFAFILLALTLIGCSIFAESVDAAGYTSRTLYRNQWFTSSSAMADPVLSTSTTGTSNYSTAAGPNSSAWYGLSTGQDTTSEYSSVAAAAKSGSTTLYSIYQFNVTYTKGTNVSSIGTTTGAGVAFCHVTTASTSCSVTMPTITPNSGYNGKGWGTAASQTSGTAPGATRSISTNTTALTANAWNTFTATFYYQSNTTSGTGTISSTTASCTTTGTSCAVTVPSAVTGSVGKYNTPYHGLASAVNSMTAAVAKSTTSITLSANATYYAIYGGGETSGGTGYVASTVTNYYPSSTSASTSQTLYRNEYLTSTSAITTVLSTSTTGTSNFTPTVVSGYGFSAMCTSTSGGGTCYSVANAAATGTRTFYVKETKSVTATFYYSNSAAGAKTSATASGTQTLWSTSTTAAGLSNGSITAPTLSGETAPTGTAAVSGFATGASSMSTTTSYNTGTTAYYRVYRNVLTIYYPTSTSAVTSKNNVIYRNAYYGSATNYTTVVANGSTGTSQLTNSGVTSSVLASMYGTFTGLATSANTTTKYDINNSGNVVNSSTTTYYAVVTASENATIHYNSNTTSGSFTDATATTAVTSTYYCSSTSAIGVSHGTTTSVPSAVSGSVGKYNMAYKGISSSSTGISNVTTFTGGSTYYAYYSSALTIYYPNTSNTVSSSATNLYRNEYYSSGSAMSAITATSQTTSTQATAPSTLSSIKGSFGGLATAVNTTTKYAINSDTIKNSGTKTYYAVTTASVTATFYYSSAVAGTKTSTTASGTQTYYCTSTSAMGTSNGSISPTLSNEVAPYGGAANGWHTAVNSMSTTSPTTANTTYYRNYSKAVTLYYYGSSYTNTTQYRNSYLTAASDTAYTTVIATTNTGLSNYSTAGGPGTSAASWYGLSTGQDTTREYSSVAAAATSSNYTFYTVYQFSVTYSKSTGVDSIGATSGSCLVTTSSTSCNVTTPTITPLSNHNTGFWGTSTSSTSGTAPSSSYSLSTNGSTLYAIATGKTLTATYYYQSNATSGSTTVTSTTASCTVSGNNTSCSADVPSAVRSSVGTYNNAYAGLSTSTGNMTQAVASGTTSLTLTSSPTYYAIYRSNVNIYGPTSTSASGTTTLYRNQWFTSTSAMSTTVLASATTGTTNASYSSGVSEYTFYGFATTASTNSRSYSSITDLAASDKTGVYAILYKDENVSATFYYSKAAAGTVGSATASGTRTTYIRPTNTTAAETSMSHGSITAPTLSGEVAPTGTAALSGFATANSNMSPTTTYNTGTTKYYRVYRNALTIYYPNTSNAISSSNSALYRNAYINTASPTVDSTTYTTITATGSTGTSQATAPGTLSNQKGTFKGITPTVNSTTYYGVDNSSNVVKNSATTYYAVVTASENATIHYNSNTTSGSFTDATATTAATSTYYCTSTSAMGTSHGTTTTVPSAVSSSVGKYNSAYKGISSSGTTISAVSSFTGGSTYYAYYQTPLTLYWYSGSAYTSGSAYRNEYYSATTPTMSSVLSTSATGTSNYSSAAGPGSSVWTGLSTGQDTTTEYSSIANAAIANASDLTTTSKLYTVYTFNTSYEKGSNVSSIGSTSGSCKVTTSDTSCNVALPSITATSGYTSVGWSTTSGATTGTAAGQNYSVSANATKLYGNATDQTKPVCSITSTNNVATSQTATLSCTDGVGVTKYYWGTSSNPSAGDYTAVTSTTNLSTTKSVAAANTYYLLAKDAAGNTSTSVNKVFYNTTFNMANGTVNPANVITMSGNSFNLPTPTASSYYTTNGSWYTNSGFTEGEKAYGTSYTPTSSITLYSGSAHNVFTPTLTMAIASEKNIYKPGDTINYTIKVKNTASYAITNVKVTDPNATIGSGTGYTVSSGTATISSLAANAEVTINASKTLTTTNINEFTNAASITEATAADAELSGTITASKTVQIQTLIKITNSVQGNMANPDQYFKVRVVINGTTGHKYTISGQDTSITYDGASITPSTTYTVGSDNYIYLKHGQTVTIGTGSSDNKIVPGATYQVIEQGGTNESNYETYINGSSTNNKDSGTITTSTTTNNNTASIVNQYGSVVATGVIAKYIPYVIIVVVFGIAVTLIVVFKVRKTVEETLE